MHTLEITIQRKTGDGWPVVVEQNKSGDFLPVRKEDTMYLDEEAQLDLTSLGELKPLTYGTILGEALFSGKVSRAFTDALAQAKGDDRLRIFLSVEAPELQQYRWGRLCAPLEDDEWDFLALNQDVPFSLYLPSSTDRRFPAIGQRDLRALILVAKPEGLTAYGMADFDVAATVASVKSALGDIPSDVLANVEGAIGLPTLDQLIERITAEQYTLLHIVAHGQVKQKKTRLYLANDQNQLDRIASDEFITELRRLRGAKRLPHFAFLCTCESAKPTDEGALGGLAQQLVQRLGMPAVLAMTEKITIPTAKTLAKKFYLQLRQHGEVDRALVEACAGLTRRRDINVPALYSRLGGRPLFSDTEDRDLTNKEIVFGLDELEKLLPVRAPILEETFAEQATKLRGKLGADRKNLSDSDQKEWDEALTEINAICEEVLDLNFRALALGQTSPAYDNRCPFPGLMAFQANDQEFFFGREGLINTLIGRLDEYPFLAVLGASGSGKSSLVLAGVVPTLHQQKPGLQVHYMTPGSDPIANLETALQSQLPLPPLSKEGFTPPAKTNPATSFLIVDQFEELFTLCDDDKQRQVFLDKLLGLVETNDKNSQSKIQSLPSNEVKDKKSKIIITMRADFLGECAPNPDLRDTIQTRMALVAPMDTVELRSAMEQQARKVDLRFEADLSHIILSEVENEPGAMPLLQHLLRQMWERRHGRWLLTSEYHNLGGIQQAITHTANEAYNALVPDQQEKMREIFIRLTRLDEDTVRTEDRRDTRRRVLLEELVPSGEDSTVVNKLVQYLADKRLVISNVNPTNSRQEVEVTHEALIEYWVRLRDWLDEDRKTLRLREGVRRAAREWEQNARDNSYMVHRGKRLENIMVLIGHPRFVLNELERAYIDTCVKLFGEMGTLEVNIDYSGSFYRRTFGYTRRARNIKHYVLVIPESEVARATPDGIFTSIRFPTDPNVLLMEQDRKELSWALEYLHKAPEGYLSTHFKPGNYYAAAVFLAAPIDKTAAGHSDEVILYAGTTGGGVSTGYQKIVIEPGKTCSIKIDLTDENGWACPWLYVYNGRNFERRTEFLRNIRGKQNEQTEVSQIGPVAIIDNTITLKVTEEKDEVSFIDELYIIADGIKLYAKADPYVAEKIARKDQDYLTISSGQSYEFAFNLPSSFAGRKQVDVVLVVSGFYVPLK